MTDSTTTLARAARFCQAAAPDAHLFDLTPAAAEVGFAAPGAVRKSLCAACAMDNVARLSEFAPVVVTPYTAAQLAAASDNTAEVLERVARRADLAAREAAELEVAA